MAPRVPQLTDDVIVEITFPSTTEEWADDLLEASWLQPTVYRDADDKLCVEARVSGNTNGLSVLKMVADEIAEAFEEGMVDPMEFTVVVRSVEA